MNGSFLYILLMSAMTLNGCGSDDHDHGHHGSDDEISTGCHHIEAGRVVTLSGSSDDPQQVSGHLRYDIELQSDTDGSDAFSGQVVYLSPGGTHYLLFKDLVTVVLTDENGQTVEPSQTDNDGTVNGCPDARALTVADLPAGEYTIDIETTMSPTVEFTIHRAGDSHDHDH